MKGPPGAAAKEPDPTPEASGETDPAPDASGETDRTITRRVGGLTVTIDRLLCVGFGDCIDEAPEAFEFDDEGIAVLTAPESADRARLLKACEICPVDAITVTDEAGRQIVPGA